LDKAALYSSCLILSLANTFYDVYFRNKKGFIIKKSFKNIATNIRTVVSATMQEYLFRKIIWIVVDNLVFFYVASNALFIGIHLIDQKNRNMLSVSEIAKFSLLTVIIYSYKQSLISVIIFHLTRNLLLDNFIFCPKYGQDDP
jgi:hypothetical protein